MDHSMHDHHHANMSGMDHSGHNMMDHSNHDMMDHSNHNMMDHSNHNMMDHGRMDHGGMDHSAHSMAGGLHSHMMMMYFHFGNDETILFDFWKISSVEGLIMSMIGIFIIAALYEGLKYYREYLFWKTYNTLQYRSVQIPADKTPSENSGSSRVVQPSMFSKNHFIQTALHVIQITVSYLLMLIFMTYNVWLCIAVVVGAATGYFLFGWKKSVVVDVTEHCH